MTKTLETEEKEGDMGNSDILSLWTKDLELDEWWSSMLGGQSLETDPAVFNLDAAKEGLPKSDTFAAEKMYERLGGYLSYIEGRKIWYGWDGKVHTPFEGDSFVYSVVTKFYMAMKKAMDVIKEMIDARADKMRQDGMDDKKVKEIEKLYGKLFNEHKFYRDRISNDQGVTSLMRSLKHKFIVEEDHFEHDMGLLVVRNGVIDFNNLDDDGNPRMHLHSPLRPVTRYLDADVVGQTDYKKSAWWEYLQSSVKDSDPEVLEYMKKVTGAAFIGKSKLRLMINLKGPPSSGKSVYVNTILNMGMSGSGYCSMPDSRAITKVRGQNFEQDKFRGCRFIAISEPSSTEHVDDDFLKRFTGDEWVETRTLNAKSTGWVPQGVLFISSNSTLRINSRDQAIVDRTQIIDFPYQFKSRPDPDDSMQKLMNPKLGDMLKTEEEKTAILQWILEGARDFLKSGQDLTPPAQVEENRSDLVSTSSPALRWLKDQEKRGWYKRSVSPAIHSYVKIDDAYQNYKYWSGSNGERKILSKRFFEEDIEHLHEVITFNGETYFNELMYTQKYHDANTINRPSDTVSVSGGF